MTQAERFISEALSLCRLLPGSWDKRFIRSICEKDINTPLSPEQRKHLWRIAKRYRRQIERRSQYVFAEMIDKHWNAIHEGAGIQGERGRFEFSLSQNPADWELRLVYSDWLEENGDQVAAEGQRWQAANQKHPQLMGVGVSYGSGGDLPFNWEWMWTFGGKLREGEPHKLPPRSLGAFVVDMEQVED